MLEKFFKKQEKVQENMQEKVQKQQELNDKDCRELTDEELEQIIGGGNTTANNELVNCNFKNNTTQSGGGISVVTKVDMP